MCPLGDFKEIQVMAPTFKRSLSICREEVNLPEPSEEGHKAQRQTSIQCQDEGLGRQVVGASTGCAPTRALEALLTKHFTFIIPFKYSPNNENCISLFPFNRKLRLQEVKYSRIIGLFS